MTICLLGFFLIPEQSHACKSHSNVNDLQMKSSHQTTKQHHHTKDSQEDDCCKSKDKESSECSGECGGKTCHSSSNSFSATPPMNAQDNMLLESKNSYLLYKQPSYSSWGSSIWQPPKIG